MDKVYDTYLSRDPRMEVKSRVKFPVQKGASDYTTQEIVCNSASTSSVNFSWTPPSESTFVCRKALIKSTLTFTCALSGLTTADGVPVGANVFSVAGASTQGASQTFTVPSIPDPIVLPQPAYTAAVAIANNVGAVCMQSFPFHRCATNVQTTLNNSQIDIDMPSYLSAMLQLVDQEDLREYSSHCPVLMDRYLNYSDANRYGVANSPFAGYDVSSFKSQILGRGSYPINVTNVAHTVVGPPIVNNASLIKVADTDTWLITFSVDTIEPILLPPWCIGKYGDENADAFLGVNRINLKYSMSSDARRVLSSALPVGNVVTTLTGVSQGTSLIVQYMNSDATQLIPERCIYNFLQVYNYTTQLGALAANTAVNAGFNNLQLGEIPSLIVLYARETVATSSARSSDFFLPITNLSISFNNRVSLLSQFSSSELYALSKRNGLKNVDFFQFLGSAQRYNVAQNTVNVVPPAASINALYLAGSIIVIDPARDLSISNPYISDASTGQFNLSWKADVKNNKATGIQYELVTLLFNSRMLLCSSGNSEIIQPALNQEQVIKTIDSGAVGVDIPNYELIGGKSYRMSHIVEKGLGGSRSGGMSMNRGMHNPSVKQARSKLDSLLM